MKRGGVLRSMAGALWFGVVVLIGSILVLGKDILVPLAIALLVWHLINALDEGIAKVPGVGSRLPGWVRLSLAFAAIGLLLYLFGRLATQNIVEVTQAAPEYKAKLNAVVHDVAASIGFDQAIDLETMIRQIPIEEVVPDIAGAVSALVGQAGLVLVYVLFLLLEQRRFGDKLRALLPHPGREAQARALLGRIQNDIKTYVWIKTVTSAATGAVSYAVLMVVGVDYAAFWAVVIFLLNYIPTIGSMLGVAFPALLALVQFDTPVNALVVTGVLGAVQFTIGNIIEPRLMGHSLNLSPLVVILSLVVWGSIWGVVGMFLCVPLTGIIMIVMSNVPATRPIAILLSSDGHIHER
ncbi:AI-2E family transporter [Rhodospira trueperi]|uniref:Predicted PurR-regulated permease PerM n=1 Tax=Rhodospira trueperi TaxID=69960 RepID=A0A1G7DWA3_9PROT|nr:AI-2E family transporter [Rhodospira trueperi]SDE55748.1 Predicted PurR-regulated permease PerM [Rhodospira trueperi]